MAVKVGWLPFGCYRTEIERSLLQRQALALMNVKKCQDIANRVAAEIVALTALAREDEQQAAMRLMHATWWGATPPTPDPGAVAAVGEYVEDAEFFEFIAAELHDPMSFAMPPWYYIERDERG